jgi:hypothetical protein
MTIFMRTALLAIVTLFATLAPISRADDNTAHPPGTGKGSINLAELEKALLGDGLTVWIHGAAPEFEQYVFTYRDANDFFVYQDFSLLAASDQVRQVLQNVGRHDQVKIKGSFGQNPSPQKHIVVTDLQVVKKFDPTTQPTWPGNIPPYQHTTQLPSDLLGKNEMLAVVHAAPENGGVVVVEYGDAVVPVFVENNTLTKNLYRGDKVKLHYQVMKFPKKPTHLKLDTSVAKPIDVIDSMVAWHERPVTLEGSLVYFVRSPQIRFDVYALQTVDKDGLKRNFTLVNLSDMQVFQSIIAKLEKVWKEKGTTAVNGRNCLINHQIRVRAKGLANVISPAQANPQILLDSANDIEILP